MLIEQAVANHTRGNLAQAEALYRKILAQAPSHFDALHLLGVVCQQTGRDAEAVGLMQKAVDVDPSQPGIHSNLGLALLALKRPEEALASLDRSLALNPDQVAALGNRGNILRVLGRAQEALESHNRALALDPASAIALNNRATALRLLDRHMEALADCNRALEITPGYPDALCNRGNVLQDLHQFSEALDSYRQALQSAPGHADSHWNEGLCRLLMGDYAQGWQKYEWRWMTEQAGTERAFSQPVWLGKESLAGKTVLIHAEQGFGDTLQFCRYVKDVFDLGAVVVVEVQPALKALMTSLDGVARVLARGEPLPHFDYHVPMLSLPLAMGTTLGSIPVRRGYLRGDPEAVARWRRRLGPKRLPRVGLVWKGANAKRSISPAVLKPLLGSNVQFFSLQKEVDAEARELLVDSGELELLAEELDFSDTAAVVDLMDLVITIDTSIAHLAGALGKKTWVLLPKTPEWRWLADREDSPWYPSVRLFRALEFGDWGGLMVRVANTLSTELNLPGR